jgi:cytidylate kinase
MIIAIDGPAGVGKSTISRLIAEKLSFHYVNSGNFYRAVTWLALEKKIDPENKEMVIQLAENTNFSLNPNGEIEYAGESINEFLHSDSVDKWVSYHSYFPEIRKKINDTIRSTISQLDAVVEGRDITTVVFPDAFLKVYLDADIQTRARRRWEQGVSDLSYEEILDSLSSRDSSDKAKPQGALKISQDALYLDTTDLTIGGVCEKVINAIKNRQNHIE